MPKLLKSRGIQSVQKNNYSNDRNITDVLRR